MDDLGSNPGQVRGPFFEVDPVVSDYTTVNPPGLWALGRGQGEDFAWSTFFLIHQNSFIHSGNALPALAGRFSSVAHWAV